MPARATRATRRPTWRPTLALLSALNLHPLDLFDGLIDFIQRLWNMGFEALGRLGSYFVLGAVVVIPVWVVLRLLSLGRRD